MSVSYKKLWIHLIEKNMKRTYLYQANRNYFKHLSQYGQRRIYIYEKLVKNM